MLNDDILIEQDKYDKIRSEYIGERRHGVLIVCYLNSKCTSCSYEINALKVSRDVKVKCQSGDVEFGFMVILFISFKSTLIGSHFLLS